ncbi:endonuclease/exonuclease/phosphatase family protein [Nonomuraea sp. B19D2]|uniref:endonuclease/exonuclease/phosphatase family protein n=1 Tax=Nonomuraea sp. B19D2 TaxID=3159561 RepID=UPI0032DAB252
MEIQGCAYIDELDRRRTVRRVGAVAAERVRAGLAVGAGGGVHALRDSRGGCRRGAGLGAETAGGGSGGGRGRAGVGLRRRARAFADGNPAAGGPVLRVLAGDFNATLDHLPMRELLASGYRDAADVMGRGFTATWPQALGRTLRPPGVTIDHVLADSRMAVRDFRVLELRHTDHRPVFADVRLP